MMVIVCAIDIHRSYMGDEALFTEMGMAPFSHTQTSQVCEKVVQNISVPIPREAVFVGEMHSV